MRGSTTGTMAKAPLDLRDTIVMETRDGESIPFSVVALLEDEETKNTYAVLLHEGETDEEHTFIVTDPYGNLVEDDELAQHVLDDYLLYNEEPGETGGE
jgi:hypothetical protein